MINKLFKNPFFFASKFVKSYFRKNDSDKLNVNLKNAYRIALYTLRERYTKNGINAGRSHFSDIWVRDSCFASLGSLSVNDSSIVKANLQTILNNIKRDGQVPLRIGQRHMILKFLGISGKPKPRYTEDKSFSTPVDSNSLFLISLRNYYIKTLDLDFIKDNYLMIKKIIDWNFTHDKDGDFLIDEEPYAGWADSLRKRGKVLYSNTLHYAAVKYFSELCKALGEDANFNHYSTLAESIKNKIIELFWNGTYFIDWIHKHKHNYFSTDGNTLAIIFGLADKEKAKSIQNCIRELDLDHGFSTKTNYPKYNFRHVFPFFFPIRIHDYHNGLEWLWIGCVDAVAKKIAGDEEKAKEMLHRIANKILEYNGVYEVYFNGKPLKRLFYHSEQGFAWSSGLFVWAYNEIIKN
jgi:glycogen debranching enzyme